MTNRMYYFGWNFFNLMWHAAAIVVDMQVFFILSTCLTTLSTCELVADDTMDGKDNMEKKTTKVAEKTDVSFRLEFSSTRMWYAVVILVDMKVFFCFSTCLTRFNTYKLVDDNTVDGKVNKEKKTRGCITSVRIIGLLLLLAGVLLLLLHLIISWTLLLSQTSKLSNT